MDGGSSEMREPFNSEIRFTSPLRKDVFWVYNFDSSPENKEFPLVFRFTKYSHS